MNLRSFKELVPLAVAGEGEALGEAAFAAAAAAFFQAAYLYEGCAPSAPPKAGGFDAADGAKKALRLALSTEEAQVDLCLLAQLVKNQTPLEVIEKPRPLVAGFRWISSLVDYVAAVIKNEGYYPSFYRAAGVAAQERLFTENGVRKFVMDGLTYGPTLTAALGLLQAAAQADVNVRAAVHNLLVAALDDQADDQDDDNDQDNDQDDDNDQDNDQDDDNDPTDDDDPTDDNE